MERENSPETKIQPVVRAVVVTLAPHEEIFNAYKQYLNESPRVFPDQNIPLSPIRFVVGIKGEGDEKRYTFLGGKIDPDENWSEAIQREIVEEAGAIPLGTPWPTIIGKFQYQPPRADLNSREVILTYFPVSFCNEGLIGDPKIKGLKKLPLDQFVELVRTGQLNGIPLEGHLSLQEGLDHQIGIGEEDRVRKNQALERALQWMIHINAHLHKKFLKIFEDNPGITLEEFEKKYEQMMSRFMRRGLEVGIKQKEKENPPRHELIEALDSGFLGKDILYYLPELAIHGVDWSGLSEASESTKIFVKFLKDIFAGFLEDRGFTPKQFEEIVRNPNILLDKKNDLFNRLNDYFRKRLMDVFGVHEEELDLAYEYVQNFFRDLSGELKVADPDLTRGLYQDFVLTNEVNNADFGTLLSIFLGVYPYELGSIQRFEAGRQLLLLFKALSGIKHYNELARINREGGRLQLALNAFFGPPIKEEIVDVGDGQQMRVRIRARNGIEFIVDEKPPKTFTSFLRKSFFERVKDIKDFYTVSVTPVNYNGNENIQLVNELIKEFIDYLKTNYGASNINTSDKRDYGTDAFLEGVINQVTGKRQGSVGSKFVRTKLVIELEDSDSQRKEHLELIVYPFFSLKEINENYMGWLEVRIDDKDYVVRRMLAGAKGIPSFYDLLFPPILYPRHYEHKLKSSFHQ